MPSASLIATGEIRTPNLRFTKPLDDSISHDNNSTCESDLTTPSSSTSSSNEKTLQDPDLTIIIERWEHLPEPVKTGIMAMVKSVEGDGA